MNNKKKMHDFGVGGWDCSNVRGHPEFRWQVFSTSIEKKVKTRIEKAGEFRPKRRLLLSRFDSFLIAETLKEKK